MTDANVWLALAAERHEHHAAALNWFHSLGAGAAVFCRVTQMTFLRLITNPAVLGEDAVEPRAAVEHYVKLRRDWRVTFASEPPGFQKLWFGLMRSAGARAWTDAYLAAFAIGHAYALVSFDRGFRRWKQLRFLPLGDSRV